MKIKKVDDKPIIIYTKDKAKIHSHEPKGARIKGRNIYTVRDTATVINDTSKGWLQAVVNDMCSYTTSTGTKDVE